MKITTNVVILYALIVLISDLTMLGHEIRESGVPYVSTPLAATSEAQKVVALRAVIRLFAHWQLTDEQSANLLGQPVVRTFQRWKAGGTPKIGPDLMARLSNLLGIHKALRLLFAQPERAYAWVKKPNQAFGGASALDIMLGGQLTDLMRVRRYLDAARG